MLSHLYRIRSMKKLLGKGELENQQIYFSPVEDLTIRSKATRICYGVVALCGGTS